MRAVVGRAGEDRLPQGFAGDQGGGIGSSATSDGGHRSWSRLGLAAFMGAAGANHFANPGFYEPLVPDWVPGSESFWNVTAGIAELVCAALLVSRRTERIGGIATFTTLLAVYPANIQQALDGGADHLDGFAGTATAAWIRLPFQLPVLAWAWHHARRPTRPPARRPPRRPEE